MHADPSTTSRVARNVRKSLAFLLGIGAVATTTLVAPTAARADVSSWFTAGGGYGFQRNDSRSEYSRASALSFSIGVGTTPTSNIVVGGLLRTTTYFTLGTDLDLSARFATGSFARGQWGLAFDIGPGWRSWRQRSDYGGFPLHAMIIGGAPWGLQLGVGANLLSLDGGTSSQGAIALLEIDLLRLTVMRQGATDRWWENPSPAGGRVK